MGKGVKILRPGVYAPVLTPFSNDIRQDLELEAFRAGVLRSEKSALVKGAKEVLRQNDLETDVPIIAGVGAGSFRETIEAAKDAAAEGAHAVIVVAPGYYSFVFGKDKQALKEFFIAVADASPVPVLLYNIPFASGGIDLDADFLIDISEHQNIVGVKLTCFNISRGHRVALHVNSAEYRSRHTSPFLVLPGSTDYMLPALVARQHGCIGGRANLYPKVCMKLFRLATEAIESGDFDKFREAQQLQDLVTMADSHINRVGFLGIKSAMDIHVRTESANVKLGGDFRRPLPRTNEFVLQNMSEGLREIFAMENSL